MTKNRKKTTQPETPAKQDRKKAKPKHGPFRRFVDNTDSIIVAVIFVLVVTQFTAATYNIPSPSMDPTLMGKPGIHGDRLIADKLYYHWHPVSRWDIAVFKSPVAEIIPDYPDREQHTIFIKRMVGIAGDSIEIRHGDIYIVNDELKGEIPYKHATTGDTLWFDAWRGLPDMTGWDVTGGSVVDNGEDAVVEADGKTVELKFKKPVLDTSPERAWPERNYPDAVKKALRDLFNPVGDVMIDATVTPQKAQGEVVFVIVEEGNEYRLRIDLAAKKAEMTAKFAQKIRTNLVDKAWDGTVVSEEIDVEAGDAARVRFNNSDDRIVAEIDGKTVFDEYAPVEPAYVDDDDFVGRSESKKNSVSLVVSDTSVAIAEMAILRDLYYMDAMFQPTPQPVSGAERYIDFVQGEPRLLMRNAEGQYEDADGNVVERSQTNILVNPEFLNATRSPYQLADDQYFALGDNTANSNDSRVWGPLSHDDLLGKAVIRFWPIPPFGPFRPGLVK